MSVRPVGELRWEWCSTYSEDWLFDEDRTAWAMPIWSKEIPTMMAYKVIKNGRYDWIRIKEPLFYELSVDEQRRCLETLVRLGV